METHQKDRLLLLMICGSIVISAMYVNNPTIDGISFQDTIHRFIPFLADYNPVSISVIFIVICFAITFLFGGKSVPSKHQDHSSSSKPEPIIQEIIIRPVVEKPRNSSGHVVEQAETRPRHVQTQNEYHTKQKKPIIYNYYNRRNRKRFYW